MAIYCILVRIVWSEQTKNRLVRHAHVLVVPLDRPLRPLLLAVTYGGSLCVMRRLPPQSCACSKKYLCHHNKTASFNTRRPTKEVIHFRKNAKRLRHGGRLDESAVSCYIGVLCLLSQNRARFTSECVLHVISRTTSPSVNRPL